MRTTKQLLTWIGVLSATIALCAPATAWAAGGSSMSSSQRAPAPRTSAAASTPRPDRSFKVGPLQVLIRKPVSEGNPSSSKASVNSGVTFKGRGVVFGKYEKLDRTPLNGTPKLQATQFALKRETGTQVRIGNKVKELKRSTQNGLAKEKLPFGFVAQKSAPKPTTGNGG
ncbi:MAG TPA: hypothetical protein VM925_35340 [Labilithrix sp.]|nr:hypothetical protein [Labilithrix sp.]